MLIKNKADMNYITEDYVLNNGIPASVIKRIEEIERTLDEQYGSDRKTYGGDVWLLCNENYFIDEVLDLYNLDEECFEYEDIIATESNPNNRWIERLYLVGTDNAVVIIEKSRKGGK